MLPVNQPLIKSFSQYLIQAKEQSLIKICLHPALRRHHVHNKPKNVQRFPDCTCSEDYVHLQGTDKNYRNYYDLCTVNTIGVFRWRWPARFAERLMLALTFCSTFLSRKKWKEIIFNTLNNSPKKGMAARPFLSIKVN